MRICLEEITRYQRMTPEPNLIVLPGDRYRWRRLERGLRRLLSVAGAK
jgi:hypothetical protein